MRGIILFFLFVLLPVPAAASCSSPWETHFACDIEHKHARAEFCRIADTEAHPSKKEAYYSYVIGDEPAELYFETDKVLFSTKDFILEHQSDTSSGMGYQLGKIVYSFFVTQDERLGNRVREAEVRVYKSADDFFSRDKNVEIARLTCDPASIVANTALIAP